MMLFAAQVGVNPFTLIVTTNNIDTDARLSLLADPTLPEETAQPINVTFE
jgi:hypothetical protein